jgi:hypothetical protein
VASTEAMGGERAKLEGNIVWYLVPEYTIRTFLKAMKVMRLRVW